MVSYEFEGRAFSRKTDFAEAFPAYGRHWPLVKAGVSSIEDVERQVQTNVSMREKNRAKTMRASRREWRYGNVR